jgi:hypothetical protein
MYSASDKNPWNIGRLSHVRRTLVGCFSRCLLPNAARSRLRQHVTTESLTDLSARATAVIAYSTRGNLGEYLVVNDPVGFEFAKLSCQHVLGDTGDRAPSKHRNWNSRDEEWKLQASACEVPMPSRLYFARIVLEKSLFDSGVTRRVCRYLRAPIACCPTWNAVDRKCWLAFNGCYRLV